MVIFLLINISFLNVQKTGKIEHATRHASLAKECKLELVAAEYCATICLARHLSLGYNGVVDNLCVCLVRKGAKGKALVHKAHRTDRLQRSTSLHVPQSAILHTSGKLLQQFNIQY